jgi:cell filamentation protein
LSQDDKYTYPGSGGVLINKLGLTDGQRLDSAMNAFASLAWVDLRIWRTERFDLPYLKRIHSEMFAPLFLWAGSERDVDTGAGDTGIVYARPAYIKDGLEDMFQKLERDDYLLGMSSASDFAEKLAGHWGYLTQIHPFRDGNTRSQSLFVSSLATSAGYPLDWRRIDVNVLRSVRLRAVMGDESALANCIRVGIGEPTGEAFLVMPEFQLDATHSAGVAVTVASDRCGKPRANGKGFCMRRVGEHGCPYHH